MLSIYDAGWYPVPWPLLGSSDSSCISSSRPSLPPYSLGCLPLSLHHLVACRTVRCLWGWGCTCPCAYMPSSHLPTLPRCRPQLLLSGPGWPGTGSCKVPWWRGVCELAWQKVAKEVWAPPPPGVSGFPWGLRDPLASWASTSPPHLHGIPFMDT